MNYHQDAEIRKQGIALEKDGLGGREAGEMFPCLNLVCPEVALSQRGHVVKIVQFRYLSHSSW